MGCVFGKYCDPSPPDSSVRYSWHIDGVILSQGDEKFEHRRAGLLYILDEAVCYRPRRLDCSHGGGSIRVEIASIQNTNKVKDYVSDLDAAKGNKKHDLVLVEIRGSKDLDSVSFMTKNSEQLHAELSDIINKHRHKPKIMQFNSIDIDGIEINP